MKQYEVVAAIIINENKILCTQRGLSKYSYTSEKYEFPGGKIDIGETKEEALIREIKEELEMDINIEKEFFTVHHEYPDFKIIMHSFICKSENTQLVLKEHIDFKWLKKEELFQLDWAGADIPIVEKLLELY
ncbi:MAG: (deoxy)nucleoside triphosphate pyrophosphohydrolase [Candidatus Sericytochromatia bacterium]